MIYFMQPVEGGPVKKKFRDFDGYLVGNDGKVWSCLNRAGKLTDQWREMAYDVSKAGYRRVGMSRKGERHRFLVHQLVLECFVGPCPSGMEACHYPDRDPANCRADNLRWDTRKANREDERRHGTLPRGESHGNSKLTEEKVVEVFRLDGQGVAMTTIAALMAVTAGTVKRVLAGKAWRDFITQNGLARIPRPPRVPPPPVVKAKKKRVCNPFTPEHRANIGRANRGRVQSAACKARIGVANRGSNHGCSKLVESDVISILGRISQGERLRAIADDYGLNPSTVSQIKAGRLWGYLPREAAR